MYSWYSRPKDCAVVFGAVLRNALQLLKGSANKDHMTVPVDNKY